MLTTAGRFSKPIFHPGAVYVAARDLSWGMGDGSSRVIAAGEVLDRNALNCDSWTLERLYRAQQIAMVLDEQLRPALTLPAQEPEVPQPAPALEQPAEQPVEQIVEAPVAHRAPFSIQSAGFGRFTVVDADDRRVVTDRWLTKSEAESIAAAS